MYILFRMSHVKKKKKIVFCVCMCVQRKDSSWSSGTQEGPRINVECSFPTPGLKSCFTPRWQDAQALDGGQKLTKSTEAKEGTRMLVHLLKMGKIFA